MTEILLVRHAEGSHMMGDNKDLVAGHATDARLTDVGHSQSAQAGEHIKGLGYPFDRFNTSPIPRARQTARGIMWSMGEYTAPRGDTRLMEQCLGKHEGRLRTEVYTPSLKQTLADKGADFRHPGKNAAGHQGESLTDAVQRMLSYVSQTHHESGGRESHVLAVTHQTVIRGLAAELELRDGALYDEPVGGQNLRNAFREVPAIGPCALSLLVVESSPAGDLQGRFEYFGESPLQELQEA